MRQLAAIAALWGCVAMAQAASGVALLEDEVLRRNGTAAPLFSFASPTAFRGYAAYSGLPATDGCYAAASVTGTKGEALTFTRATTRFCPTDGTANEATGVMCSSGQVCISTLNGKRGISVFRAGTNLALRSEEFDNAAWTKINGAGPVAPVVTANSAECGNAPDGTQTAEKVEFPAVSAATSYSLLRQSITYAALSMDSVWVKRLSGGSKLYVSNGVLTSNTSRDCAPSSSWSRCSVTSTTTGGGFFDIGTNLNMLDQTSTVAITVCVWGSSAVSGVYATPYIKTEGASATRNAEVPTFANVLASGSLASTASAAVTWHTPATISTTQTPMLIQNVFEFQQINATHRAYHYPSSAWVNSSGSVVVSSANRLAAYADGTNKAACREGTCSTAAGSGSFASPPWTITVGFEGGAGTYSDGIIGDICVDPSPSRCR